MIPYINDKLIEWAWWSLKRTSPLGYKPSILGRLSQRCSEYYSSCIPYGVSDNDLSEIDTIVCLMPHNLKEVVVEYYQRNGTTEQKARKCRCTKQTLFNRLHRAHVLIMEALQVGVTDVPELAAQKVIFKDAVKAPDNSFKKLLTA